MIVLLLALAWSAACNGALLIAHAKFDGEPELTRYAIGTLILWVAICGWAWSAELTDGVLSAGSLALASISIIISAGATVWGVHRADVKKLLGRTGEGYRAPSAEDL